MHLSIKKWITFLPVFFYFTNSFPQDLSIIAKRGTANFIENMPGVLNRFDVLPPDETDEVRFTILDENNDILEIDGAAVLDFYDKSLTGGWRTDLDMMNVKPGSKLQVQCLDVDGNIIASAVQEFDIIPEPAWLNFDIFSSKILDVRVVGTTLKMTVHVPVGGDESIEPGYYFSDTIMGASIVHQWEDAGNVSAYATSSTCDKYGNLFLGGSFTGTFNTGAETLTTTDGMYCGYLLKKDTDRNTEWAIKLGGESGYDHFQNCRHIVVDDQQNIYVLGTAYHDADKHFNNITVQDTGFYLAKFDRDGYCLWTRFWRAETSFFDFRTDLAVDPDGNCYIATQNHGSVFMNGVEYDVYEDGFNYIMKFNSNGTREWLRYYKPDPDEDDDVYSTFWINGVDADRNGNVYITGEFNETLQLGSYTLENSSDDPDSDEDIFIAQLDADNGNVNWAKAIGGVSRDQGGKILVDMNDACFYLMGTVDDTVAFGNGVGLMASEDDDGDMFLAKYTPEGECEWATIVNAATGHFSTMGAWYTWYTAQGLAEDCDGNILFAGGNSSSIKVVSIDTLGNQNWCTYGSIYYVYDIGLSADLLGNVHFTGNSSINGSLGGTSVGNSSNRCGFYGSIKEAEIENIISTTSESSNFIPDDVDPSFESFSGMKFNFKDIDLSFDIEWDLENAVAGISEPEIGMQSSILSELYSKASLIPDDITNAISIDENFDLNIELYKKIDPPALVFNGPCIDIPVCSWATVYFTFGAKLGYAVAGRILIGTEGDEFGFISIDDRSTSLLGEILGDAWIRGGLSVLYGAAEAYGTLTLSMQAGGGIEYISIPASEINALFGMNFQLTGSITLAVGWGLVEHEFGPKTFVSEEIGDLPELKNGRLVSKVYGNLLTAETYKANATFENPEHLPQPLLATNGNDIASVWVYRKDSLATLELSYFNSNENEFGDAVEVAENTNGLTYPAMAMFSDGTTLVSWSQNTYSSATVPADIHINDILANQDIHLSFFKGDTLLGTYIIEDTEQRADGKSGMAIAENSAILGWEVYDTLTKTNSLYYVDFDKSDYETFDPTSEVLTSLSGDNYKLKINFMDEDNAMAFWINDPDGSRVTFDSRIMYSKWDGSSWSSPKEVVSEISNRVITDIYTDFNQDYGILSWTSTQIFSDNTSTNYISLLTYNISDDTWETDRMYSNASSTELYSIPNVSINENNYAALSYYSSNTLATPNDTRQGDINLFVRNIDTEEHWTGIDKNEYMGDSSTYVWFMANSFTDNEELYLLTQEIDSLKDINRTIKNGVKFAEPDLFMVLRSVKLDSDNSISDISEPTVPKGLKYNASLESDIDFMIYPNVITSDEAYARYQLDEDARVTISIYSLSGRLIDVVIDSELTTGVYNTYLNLTGLTPGIYIVRLRCGNHFKQKKLVRLW